MTNKTFEEYVYERGLDVSTVTVTDVEHCYNEQQQRIEDLEYVNERYKELLINASKRLNNFYRNRMSSGHVYEITEDEAYHFIGYTRDEIDIRLKKLKESER